MNKNIGIILGVVLGAVIVIGISAWIISSIFSQGSQSNNSASTPKTIITSPTPTKSMTSSTSSGSPTAASQNPAQDNVNFSLSINNFNVSGPTSGTVNAQVTNTGTVDAHNVWVKVEIIYQGSIVKIGGQDYLRKDLGTLAPGQTVTSQVTLSVSLTDGIKIAQNGATFRLTVYSDEKTQTMSYDYHT